MTLHLKPFLLGLLCVGWIGLGAVQAGFGRRTARAPGPVLALPPSAWEVVDGDTLRAEGREFRLLGIDTPEKAAPWFRGDQEPWASRAAARVEQILGSAETVEVRGYGRQDRYGRELVQAFADGRSIALILVREGLAYCTVGRYGDSGFPELAVRLVAEARPPPFQKPWIWRRTHRLRD
jgi:endonuclease YncB( thermonuclease family)